MSAKCEFAKVEPDGVSNRPGHIGVGVNPPNELVLYIPIHGGTAAVHVDATEFDQVMDLAHEKLVEYAADHAKAQQGGHLVEVPESHAPHDGPVPPSPSPSPSPSLPVEPTNRLEGPAKKSNR